MELTLDQALQKGIEAHKAGKTQEADRYYTAILKAQPKHPDANHNMGVLAVGIGKVEAALPFFKTALEANSNVPQFWLSYIDALIKLSRIDDAKAVFDQAKSQGAKGDGFDQTQTRLMTAQHEPSQNQIQALIKLSIQEKYKEALSEASKLLLEFPKSVNLYNIIGVATQGLGRLEDAIQAFKNAISIKPNDADTYYNMGNALLEQGQIGKAIQAYTKALSIKPDYVDAYNNLGSAFKRQGKIEKAIQAYTKAISIKPDYADAHNNIGNALVEKGEIGKAIQAYTKALSIKPDYVEVYYNMGNALIRQGKIEKAIQAYTKAISIKPDYADAHNNLGNALVEKGKVENAIQAYTKAISIKPDYVDAHNNLGSAFKRHGKIENAIQAYTKAISIKPDYADAYYNMGNALKNAWFKRSNPSVENAIIAILDRDTIVRPIDIAGAVVSLLKCNAALKDFCSEKVTNWSNQSFDEIILILPKIPLLLKIMSVCPLPDLDLERGITSIRSYLLSNISEICGTSSLFKVQSAIALQCFTNEYIYDFTSSDTQALEELERSVRKILSNGEQPKPQIVLCLASFTALHEYDWSHHIQNNPDIDEVFKRQILEPMEENELKSQITVLEEITDKISIKVREQYEENPYPRWVKLGLRHKAARISKIIKEANLKVSSVDIISVKNPNILVAGCGTGQHSIGTACRFKNSKVLAVDLSLSSLAYAKRKTINLGIQNINYIQADILKLHKLNQRFDIIESSGVLHHMRCPIEGWKVLVDCLKSGGLMKIALYSESARQPVVNYRSAISKSRLVPTHSNIRALREQITTAEDTFSRQFLYWSDFFSMSELRDLIFHVQEHRFTLPQVKKHLKSLGLKFCGFEDDRIIQAFKATNQDKNALYDLDKWTEFEKDNVNAFVGMYQFWCQKID